jgi:phosphoenolpyruvate carboxylase
MGTMAARRASSSSPATSVKTSSARREIDRPLRRDVRWLGRLLGEVLIELEGQELFALEEKIRKLAILRRRGPREERGRAALELTNALAELTPEQASPVIRAFSLYFRLVNLAEQHHRVRRARAHGSHAGGRPQRGSLAAVMLAAKESGVSASRMRDAIATLDVTLTFTAHPSEATRRTVLEKLYRIAHILEHYDRCHLTAAEKDDAMRDVREEIKTLWHTDEVRRDKPRVGDEVKNVAWYIEEVLWDLLPSVPRQLARAFERAYGEKLESYRVPVRIHSWVGGDMDGNPFVTPDVLDDAIRAYEARGLRRLLAAARDLGGALSQSSRYAKPSAALLASIERDRQRMSEVAEDELARTEGEPWRRKMRFIEARLAASLASVERDRENARRSRPPQTDGKNAHLYRDASELEADLTLVAESLHEVHGAGERRARALLERVRALGFAIAELEMRTPAADARVADEAMRGVGPTSEGATRLVHALERIADAQKRGGETACRTLILSMTESADDVLAALRVARRAGVWNAKKECVTLDVVPLFETLHALEQSASILQQLLDDPTYREHVKKRGAQEVMVGYSDSGKEVGMLAAAAALRRTQQRLPAIAAAAGIAIRIFHGRGETVARGGGPAQQAILALPAGSVGGRYKATEQGEALDHKYGRPELAQRTLELMVGGALLHSVDAQMRPAADVEERFDALFAELADVGRRVYRALVWENPRFAEFFFAATPVEEIARLPIGSRPSKRHAGGLDALRAIPWVFAWTQTRAILPAWYGVGSAFEEIGARPEGRADLLEMYERWPFFRTVVDNIEMVVAKTDLAIAARYADLAPPEAKRAIWPAIREEHHRTKRWIKVLTRSRKLLEKNPTLERSIRLRNPYVDPLNLMQVELVRRRRAGDDNASRPLLLTVNGIAAGMRNTG